MTDNVIYRFQGKKFIIIGASSGMGKQTTIELAEAGAVVLAVARRKERLEELKLKYPNNIMVYQLDICQREKIDKMIKSFVDLYGKINGCVYAAGVSDIAPLRSFNESRAKEIMDINCWCALNFIRIANKKKYAEDGCSTVLFSSVAGYIGEKGLLAYSISKAALQIAAKTIAKEIYKNKHRINTISPGWVKTEMTEREIAENGLCNEMLQRHLLGLGVPEDVSGMVLFLLSDRSRWITGTDIVIDGGYLLGGYN